MRTALSLTSGPVQSANAIPPAVSRAAAMARWRSKYAPQPPPRR